MNRNHAKYVKCRNNLTLVPFSILTSGQVQISTILVLTLMYKNIKKRILVTLKKRVQKANLLCCAMN